MTRVSAWFDRKFDFSFPADLYPNVAARLRGTPARIEEILRACPESVRIAKPQGKWSAQEHAGHLLDLEPLWAARVNDFANGATELTVADLTNRGTTEANHNAGPLDGILLGFREARARLLARAERVDPALWERTILHPRLKQPMRLVDHLFFVAEHDDHHIAHMLASIG